MGIALTILPLLPFVFELVYDWRRIVSGESDLPLWLRIVLVIACSVTQVSGHWTDIDIVFSSDNIALATAPFCFFDPLLNKLRGLKWDKPGSTKAYDRFLARFDSYKLMVVRVIAFIGLILYWWL